MAAPASFQNGCRCAYSVLGCLGSLLSIHLSEEVDVLGVRQFLSFILEPAHLLVTISLPFDPHPVFLDFTEVEANVRIRHAYRRLSTPVLTPDLPRLRGRVAALLSIPYPGLALRTLVCLGRESTPPDACLLLQSKLLFDEVAATVSGAPRCIVVPIFLNR